MSMKLIKLYAELQNNPFAPGIYRDIERCYREMQLENEANAFKHLIDRKFNVHNTDIDEEQRDNNRRDSKIP